VPEGRENSRDAFLLEPFNMGNENKEFQEIPLKLRERIKKINKWVEKLLMGIFIQHIQN